jgi:peptidoglycan hydrolase-like protein with peptidoglycan-binding domain
MEGVVVDKVCRVLDDLLALSAIGRERLVAPAPVPEVHHDAAALNALGADPQLVVDDSFGRATRHAVMAFQRAAGLTCVPWRT